MASQPFWLPDQDRSLLCNEVVTANEKKQNIGTPGLSTVKERAALWATIKVSEGDKPYHEFTWDRMTNKSTETLQAHPTCRLKFRTHLLSKRNQYGQQEDIAAAAVADNLMPTEVETEEEEKKSRRSSTRNIQQKSINFVCFICNTRTPNDTKPYSDGGLGRCSDDRAFKKLNHKMKLTSPGDKYEEAAKRLNLLLSGQAFDVFAVDVYYHKTCYVDFSRPIRSSTEDIEQG